MYRGTLNRNVRTAEWPWPFLDYLNLLIKKKALCKDKKKPDKFES